MKIERQRRGYWKGVVYWSVNVGGRGDPGDWRVGEHANKSFPESQLQGISPVCKVLHKILLFAIKKTKSYHPFSSPYNPR